jgi:predicted CopG family antitoxin
MSKRFLDTTTEPEDDEIALAAMKEKLKPRPLLNVSSHLMPQQFVHLHHMKTGGTSFDDLLNCLIKRFQQTQDMEVDYMNVHECSGSKWKRCLNGESNCRDKILKASLMSYCAPLHYLSDFGWDYQNPDASFGAVTVLRHPVDRVWSQYRFVTKGYYKCRPLKDIYAELDAGGLDNTTIDRLSIQGLMNHQTVNLLTTTDHEDESVDYNQAHRQEDPELEKQMVEHAISSLNNFFTLVGVTEELDSFSDMLTQVFPWMAKNLPDPTNHRVCRLGHSNKSPKNNKCGPDQTHWDLPPHPDDETRAWIEKYNQMDMQVYEAAVKLVHLEKRALGMD